LWKTVVSPGAASAVASTANVTATPISGTHLASGIGNNFEPALWFSVAGQIASFALALTVAVLQFRRISGDEFMRKHLDHLTRMRILAEPMPFDVDFDCVRNSSDAFKLMLQ